MVTLSERIRRARCAVPPECHLSVQRALASLPARRIARRQPGRGAVALAACAALVAAGLVVVSIPAGRAGTERALRAGMTLLAGRVDNDPVEGAPAAAQEATAPAGPAATPAAYHSVIFGKITDGDGKYAVVTAQAAPVGATQVADGVTATVVESAIAGDRLFLGFRFDGLPNYCFPAEEAYTVWVDGRKVEGSGAVELSAGQFSYESKTLPVKASALPDSFPVRVTFTLRQFPDGGVGRGEEVASFDVNFQMSRPATLVELPAEERAEKPGTAPAATSAPNNNDRAPSEDASLTEPAGVRWAAYKNDRGLFSLEYPEDWKADRSADWMPVGLAGRMFVLDGFRGTGGSVYVCAANFDTEDLAAGADRVADAMAAATGNTYAVSGNQVYYIWDNSKSADRSCILAHPVKPWLTVDGKPCNFLLIWAPKEYNNHILKSLELIGSPAKAFGGAATGDYAFLFRKDHSAWLSFDAPAALKSAALSGGKGLDGVPDPLKQSAEAFDRLEGGGEVVNLLYYRPGTDDIDRAAAALSDRWTVLDRPVEVAGQEALLLKGKAAGDGSLLLIRTPKATAAAKNAPFLVVRAPDGLLGGILATVDVK